MTSSPTATPPAVRDDRRIPIALIALFFGSLLLAAALRFSGWRPQALRNHGQLLSAPVDLRAHVALRADGQVYAWAPAARRWRIALAPPPGCMSVCVSLAGQLHKVWQLLGHRADRVEVLWIGTPPPGLPVMPALRVLRADAALRRMLPGVDDAAGVPVYVIDPHGFVMLRFSPGFDPAGLYMDLAELLKLM